jgi:DeoR/GlpR family transcriptional regulator of sugar metabolism
MTNRQRKILERVELKGACSYQDLTDAMAVSSMTVRRDVDRLAALGRVVKVLGGVQRADAPANLYESELRSRLNEAVAEKRAIAQAAAALIPPHATIFLDGSTTCLELAKYLAEHHAGLTIVTHSAATCSMLGRSQANMIVSLGGQYDPSSGCFIGPTCEEQAARYFVDIAFVSTKGFVPDEGTFESSVATYRIKQIVAAQCPRVALLVDNSKFGRRALRRVLDSSQIHTVVTDAGTSRHHVAEMEAQGMQVIVAAGAAASIATPGVVSSKKQ